MNSGNPWGNYYGQLPPTSQQYDAPMSHILPTSAAGLQSVGLDRGGVSPGRSSMLLPGTMAYQGGPGSLLIEPPLGPQQPYKSVIVTQPPMNLGQGSPTYSLPGINDPGKPWGSCNTVDASILGLSGPPPAHSGHTQVSPGLYKMDQPTVISAAHQSAYKPIMHSEPVHAPVHSVYQEPRINRSAGYNNSPIGSSSPTTPQQSSAFFCPQGGGNPYSTSPNAFNVGEQYNTNLSFQDMQDMGSGKVPIQMQQQQQHSPHTSMHHSPHMPSHPSPLTSPHLGARNSPLTPTHSPHAHSQSPQSSVAISSTIPMPPVPVQALADSTTKPRRRRSKKSKASEENEEHHKTMNLGGEYQTPISGMQQHFSHMHDQMQFDRDISSVTREMTEQMFQSEAMHQGQLSQIMHQEMMMQQQGATTFIYNDQQQYMNNEYLSPTGQLDPQTMYVEPEPEPEPQRVTVVADLEEEFGHLSTPPKIPPPKPKTPPPPPPAPQELKESPPPKLRVAPAKPKPTPQQKVLPKVVPQVPVPTPPVLPKGPRPVDLTSFQSSFLSFIGGKKPETLSSVTNSEPKKKPVLPKYAPDTRSAATAPIKTSAEEELSGGEEESNADADSVNESISVNESNSVVESSSVNESVAYVEDVQDDSQHSSTSESSSLKMATKSTPRGRVRGRGRGRGRGKTDHGSRTSARNNDVMRVLNASGTTEDSNDGDIPSAESVHTPSPPPVQRRPSSGRRAAAVGQQKLRNLKDDSDSDADFVATAESSDVSEAGYDSDKDPSWDPSENPLQKRGREMDSDDEVLDRRGRGRGKRFRHTPKSTSRGRRRGSRTVLSEEDLIFASVKTSVPETPAAPIIVDIDAPHKYQRTDFVVDRKDYESGENFAIWRIDASRLLQKFEAVVQDDGSIFHKSLSTYSSWSGDIRSQFRGVVVRAVSHVGGVDTVKLLDDFWPKKSAKVVPEDDPMLEKFTIYVQVLISQAMEPGFLRAITEEKDEYYNSPMELIDGKLNACREIIIQKVNWKEEFQKMVETYPHLTIMARPNMKGLCQACDKCGTTASKMVQFYGAPYSRETLHADETSSNLPEKRDVPSCAHAAQHLQPYHSSYHFKHGLFKRCNAKVSMVQEEREEAETREILDQCLQNRTWVNKLFAEFQELISPE